MQANEPEQVKAPEVEWKSQGQQTTRSCLHSVLHKWEERVHVQMEAQAGWPEGQARNGQKGAGTDARRQMFRQ